MCVEREKTQNEQFSSFLADKKQRKKHFVDSILQEHSLDLYNSSLPLGSHREDY